MHLALDHLTVTEAYPWEIAALAAEHDFQGCCLFLESMSVLPTMPTYSLLKDQAALKRTRDALDATGVTLDLVYPFTVTSRSQTADFEEALEAAGILGSGAINLLVYDRDFDRAVQSVSALADAAQAKGMDALIEFYPASAVKSLDQAHRLVEAASRPNLGINVDILHLYRSGGSTADLAEYDRYIRFAQLADGPLSPPDDLALEAAQARLDPGQGQFDLAGFVDRLPPVPVSLEIPQVVTPKSVGARLAAIKRAVTAIRRG